MSKFELPNNEAVITKSFQADYRIGTWDKHESDEVIETFVLNVLNRKTNGIFVEIGSEHPKSQNNTYYLEKFYSWTGLAIDINPHYVEVYSEQRTTPCFAHDARTFDYKKYFESNNFPKQIDFLQIDIDLVPRGVGLQALVQLPLNDYRFSVIAFEHAAVHDFTVAPLRDAQRYLLDSLGYRLVVQGSSDDLWVDPNAVHLGSYEHLIRDYDLVMPSTNSTKMLL